MKRTILALAFAFALCAKAHAGTTVYRVEVSTPTDTPILLQTGPGVLYGVDCSSGTSTAFAIAYDASSTSGITFTTTGKAITPSIFSNANTASSVPNAGWNQRLGPPEFYSGLVALTHGSAINCLFRVGPNNGA